MDDPWGSPWADESPQFLPTVETSALPRPVTPEQLLLTRQKELYPWGADNGFEDWADTPVIGDNDDSASTDKAYESNEWGGVVAKTGHDKLKKLEDDIKHSRFSEDTTSPRVENSTSPGRVQEDTETAQDPWANVDTPKIQNSLQMHDVEVRTPLDTKIAPISLSINDLSKDEMSVESREDNTQKRTSEPEQDAKLSSTSTSFSKDDITEPSRDTDGTQPNAKTYHEAVKDTLENDIPLSRPSSSPSDHSNHDEMVESPRTSFEDDPKRPKLERKESSKVKQLVQLFDGLAVTEVEPDQSSQERRRNAESNNDTKDEFGDFGDFEEGDSVRTAEDDLSQEHSHKSLLVVGNNATMTEGPISERLDSKTEHVSPPVVRHGPVEFDFDFDLSLIDIIFGLEVPTPAITNLDARPLSMDNLQETFSTIAERKVWYRISRYGTIRKYNTGDEDYVRINWPNSEVRKNTLQHVSKWMEEDRIGGGVILGGTNRSVSMFGWGDKTDRPITLETAFAAHRASRRKSSKSYSRKSSIHGKVGDLDVNGSDTLQLRNSASAESNEKANSREVPTVLAGPQFHWSTSQPTFAGSETQSPVFKSPISRIRMSQSLTSAPSEPAEQPILSVLEKLKPLPNSSQVMLPPTTVQNQPGPAAETVYRVKATRPTAIAVPSSNVVVDDEEDEWGEMVSSPASDLAPHPPPQQLGHKSSKSMINILSPILSSNSPALRNYKSSINTSGLFMHAESPAVDIDTSISNSRQNATISIPSTATKDLWTSADFSFFDTLSAPPTQSREALAIQNETVSLRPTPQRKSQVSATPYRKSEKEIENEEEKIVKNIVNNLPDLSYMLRR